MNKLNVIPKKRLMIIVESIAKKHYGGHFTLMSFTTNVKFSFGTITDRDEIENLEPYLDVNDAIINAIQEHFTKDVDNILFNKC